MIMPGHLAAGYLATIGIIKFFKPELDANQLNLLLIWGTFFGIAPDLDSFYVFFKNRRFIFKDESINHRDFLTHVPLIWLIICGTLICVFSYLGNDFAKYIVIALLVGALSHFILDSIQMGVMWLWPVSRRKFALLDRYHNTIIQEKKFVAYWFRFIKLYAINFSATFWAEIVVTVIGVIVFLKRLS